MSTLILRLRAERASAVRFLATGVLGALLNVGVFALLANGLGVDYRVAVVVAFAVSYLFSFVAHRTWTFSATDGHAGHQGLRFTAVSVVATGCALLVTVAAVEAFGLPKSVGEFAAAVVIAPVTFVLHRRFTFVTEGPARPPAPHGPPLTASDPSA